jgi:serine/threonine-protein kinase
MKANRKRIETAPHTVEPGTVLHGTYRILRPLAEGGCGEIYVAVHTRLPREFAVKLLHRHFAASAQALSRFRREAEITSALRHPHVVQVVDFNVTDDGIPYLVMELLDGQSLAKRVASLGVLDPFEAVGIIDQIAEALDAAHTLGIVHRDLKPENVILLPLEGCQDFVKVVDFGISHASWGPRLTIETRVAGTPQFMAPEQALGMRDEIDHRTDQFALAAMAYNMLTGREPFSAAEALSVMYQVVHEAPPPPSSCAPWLTAAVDAVVAQGLAKRPADRFPDTPAFARALRWAVRGAASPPPPRRTSPAALIALEPTMAVAARARPR